ncbi:transcription termination factor 4, mitochondrial isoform X2 [Dermochelys coriacea]|uniref:transcription termination factor 4, mitochondrial isoform X2 n=1 Tax=Dermochelys coriacea TaxID=27794 RepID=UPI001CAA2053|nr:transcription termination factor 4, mitochondrial isoform X2 [Dermochelys coriacea]
MPAQAHGLVFSRHATPCGPGLVGPLPMRSQHSPSHAVFPGPLLIELGGAVHPVPSLWGSRAAETGQLLGSRAKAQGCSTGRLQSGEGAAGGLGDLAGEGGKPLPQGAWPGTAERAASRFQAGWELPLPCDMHSSSLGPIRRLSSHAAWVLWGCRLVPSIHPSVTRQSWLCASPSAGLPASFCPLLSSGCRLASVASSEWSGGSLSSAGWEQDRNEPEPSRKLLEAVRLSLAAQQRQADIGRSELGKMLDSFSDMGFSNAQIMELFRLQPKLAPQTRLAVVSELLLLGLDADSTLRALQKSPEVLRMSAQQLRHRVDYLRRLDLGEENLQQVVSHCPRIFTFSWKKIDAVVRVFKEKCIFTVDQVTEILHRCSNVLLEEPHDLEYKFQVRLHRSEVQFSSSVPLLMGLPAFMTLKVIP